MTTYICALCKEPIHVEPAIIDNVIKHGNGNCVRGDETETLIWVHDEGNEAACKVQSPKYSFPVRYAQE